MNNSAEGGGVYRGDRPPARKKKKESETQDSNNREIFSYVIIGILSVKMVWVPLEFVNPFLSGPET